MPDRRYDPTPANIARAHRIEFTDTRRGCWRGGCVGVVVLRRGRIITVRRLATGERVRVPVGRVDAVLTFKRAKAGGDVGGP